MTTLVRCGRIITGHGEVLDGRVITIDDEGRIEAIGQSSAHPTIDWSRHAVMPGLIDCHDHLGIDMGDEGAQAHESVARHMVRSLVNARRILRAGITTLRDCGEKGYFDVELRDAFARGDLLGPRLVVSGQVVTRTGGHFWYFTDEADGEDAVRRIVRKQVKHGADFIKIMATGGIGTARTVPTEPGFTREELHAAIDEAHALGRKAAAHIHGGPAARWAIESGLDTLEHGKFLEREDLELMAEHGTYLVVNWGVSNQSATSSRVTDDYRRKAARAKANYDQVLTRAIEMGVHIAVGSDTYHAAVAEEVSTLVRLGMPPMKALEAATRNGAEVCGLLGETGTIEVGRAADLIALDGDPLEDIAAVGRVRGVLKQGSQVPLE